MSTAAFQRPAPVAELLNSTLDLFGNWTDTVELERPASEAGPGVSTGPVLVRRNDSPVAPHQSQKLDPAPRRKALRDHIADVDAIANMIELMDDEDLTEEKRDELSAMLIAAIAGTRAKVDSTSRVLAMFEALEAAPDPEIERLQARKQYYARQKERLEKYVLATMTASQLDQLDGEISTLKRKKNPASAIPDQSLQGPLPAALMRAPKPQPWNPDKTSIKAAIAAGREVPGWICQQEIRLVRS